MNEPMFEETRKIINDYRTISNEQFEGKSIGRDAYHIIRLLHLSFNALFDLFHIIIIVLVDIRNYSRNLVYYTKEKSWTKTANWNG
jgi:hypothetical protein